MYSRKQAVLDFTARTLALAFLLSTIYLLSQPRITLFQSKAQPTSQTFAICL